MTRASRFAAVWAVLDASHAVADHWVQVDAQAGQPPPWRSPPSRTTWRTVRAGTGVTRSPRGVVALAASTGHRGWLERDPNAGYLLDQSWHRGWLLVAAAVAS